MPRSKLRLMINCWPRGLGFQIAQVIETETKYQNELLNQLEETMAKAQAGVKTAMKRMSKSVIQNGSNHLLHVVLFGILFFTLLYLWAKFLR
ncbi:protein transport protein SFT1 [Marchantia polymorpha subsp. ruderalis]|uniref:t-SNARE coiled-coil homology domain-containing protein n=2 Tax=Marchantia polymorpha TaxID=3197 RepID=A0AAF6AY07_MARPO|nr:hypothetical protein MARPO_0006s0109 [Marchantia polymorpha]BBN04641.1 hypothetical protein Mp_3g06390 [Marchantia polymorpha subsp. ruderalis]|eukprot:PTQ48078.1 hypothetical protein MARPO_0006s0109 [Marchantia polymorpha]